MVKRQLVQAVIDGRTYWLAADWRPARSNSPAAVLETQFFTPLTQAESRDVALAIQRYGEFLQLPVVCV